MESRIREQTKSQSIDSDFVLFLKTNLQLTAGFRQRTDSLELDQLFSSTPVKTYKLGFSWKPSANISFSTGLRLNDCRDLLSLHDCDSREEWGNVHINRSFGKLSIHASADAKGNDENSFTGKYACSAVYEPTDNQSYTFQVNHNTESLINCNSLL